MRSSGRYLLWSLALVAANGGVAHAESVTINGVTYEKPVGGGAMGAAGAPARGEDTFKLKKIFIFPSLDDLSGVLTPKLDERLTQIFARHTRFDVIRDTQVARALSPDDQAYAKAAVSPQVHREAARVTGADTTVILRSRSVGNETEMALDFRDANGDLLFSETGSVPGFSSMQARWSLIDRLFQAVLAKVPFDGTVTGRSAGSVTIDLGSSSVRTGEEIELARVVSVQRHPLLRTVVGTDYVRAGRARVTATDRALSFAEIVEEFPGESVGVGTKVLLNKASTFRREGPGERPEEARADRAKLKPVAEDDALSGGFDDPRARFGHLGLNLGYGSLSQSQTAGGATSELSGSGFGGTLDGELWITRNWILLASYGFQNASLAGGGVTAGDSSWNKLEVYGGYRLFPAEPDDSLSVTGAIGYQAQDFTVPTPSGFSISGKKYTGIALRLDGEMAFHRNHRLTGGFGFQPFSSFTDQGASPGSPDGGNLVSFRAAWNYRFAPNLWGRLGVQFDSANGNYANNASVNSKRFAIGPGIYYSF